MKTSEFLVNKEINKNGLLIFNSNKNTRAKSASFGMLDSVGRKRTEKYHKSPVLRSKIDSKVKRTADDA